MAFPKSNLPSAAQPWGREVQKRTEVLESLVATDRINNAARDKQLAGSYDRLNATVLSTAQAAQDASSAAAAASAAATTANNAIAGLTSLGSIDSDYTINAGNINAGTLTGVTVQTAASGTRLALNSSVLDIYYAGAPDVHVGRLSGTNSLGFPEVSLTVPGSLGPEFEDGIYIGPGVTYVQSSNSKMELTGETAALGVGAGSTGAGGIQCVWDSANPTDRTENYVYGNLTTDAALSVAGTSTLKNDVYYESRPASSVIGTPIHVRTSGANTNLLFDYTSSRRYKTDIVDLDIDYDKFTSIPVRSFLYKSDEEEYGPNAQRGYGYIAEELDEAGFADLVVYRDTEDGGKEPHSLAFQSISAVTQVIVNKQAEMIKQLQSQVESLSSAVAELQSKVQ